MKQGKRRPPQAPTCPIRPLRPKKGTLPPNAEKIDFRWQDVQKMKDALQTINRKYFVITHDDMRFTITENGISIRDQTVNLKARRRKIEEKYKDDLAKFHSKMEDFHQKHKDYTLECKKYKLELAEYRKWQAEQNYLAAKRAVGEIDGY